VKTEFKIAIVAGIGGIIIAVIGIQFWAYLQKADPERYNYDTWVVCNSEKQNLLQERGQLSAAVTDYNLKCSAITGQLFVTSSYNPY
jgi:hypothetical protein